MRDHKSRKMEASPYEPARMLAVGNRTSTLFPTKILVVSDVANAVPPMDLNSDWLRVVVDRSEVEALNVSHAATELSRVLANRNTVERYRKNVDLTIFGYSNDPRELFEIPEV